VKSTRKLAISFLLLSLAWAIPVSAAPLNPSILVSPPVSFEIGADDLALACNIANISGQRRDVIVQVMGAEGDVVLTEDATLEPGAVFGIADDGGANPAYCRFFVGGLPENYRASACVEGGGSACVEATGVK
jgi:hypothetical protein